MVLFKETNFENDYADQRQHSDPKLVLFFFLLFYRKMKSELYCLE